MTDDPRYPALRDAREAAKTQDHAQIHALLTPWHDTLEERDALLAARAATHVGADSALPLVERLLRDAQLPTVRLSAARLLDQLGHPVRAAEHLSQLLDHSPEATVASYELGSRLGRDLEATHTLRTAVAALPNDALLCARLAKALLSAHADDDAAQHVHDGLSKNPDDPQLLDLAARIAARLRSDDAVARILAAQPHTSLSTTRARLEAIGCPDRAHDLLTAHAAAHPEAQAGLAHHALWRLDLPAARAALALAPADHPEAQLVSGALAVLDGQHDVAIATLQRAAEQVRGHLGFDHPLTEDTVQCWLSEAYRAAGDHEAAKRAAKRARDVAFGYQLAAHLMEMLSERPWVPLHAPTRATGADLTAYATARHPEPFLVWSSQDLLTGDAPEELRQVLAGNRTRWPTLSGRDGDTVQIQPMPPPTHGRHLARPLQLRMRVEPLDQVLARFLPLQQARPDDPTLHTYYGELLLWSGRLSEAAKAFKRAGHLYKRTTWAWVGLGACHLLAGRPERAVEILNLGGKLSGIPGPTTFAYRGEALWRLGRLDEAIDDLSKAARNRPSRLASWVGLALIRHEQGQDAPAALLDDLLRSRCPGPWNDLTGDTPVARLEDFLRLMRGNRSSTIRTYWPDDDTVRFVRWSAPDTETRRALLGA